jgi:TPP-dependent pyruvate/acetoin dehydrogenase alpha subunit
VEAHKKKDPILLAKNKLIEEGLMTEQEYEKLEEKAKAEVDEAVRIAIEAPYPKGEEAAGPVYAEEVNHG